MNAASIPRETYRVAWGDLVYIKENLVEVLVTTLLGPLLYLLAFGFGIGGSVSSDPDAYIAYIVPGIVALTTLSSTFNSVSMKILVQRKFYMSFDELLLCPVHISSIILGKTLAGVVRGMLSCTVIMIVGWLISPQVSLNPLTLVAVFFAALTFSMLGLLAGLVTTKTQQLNLFSAVAVVPMTFLCGTLFDVDALPSVASWVVYALPLTHVSALVRGMMLGTGIPLDSVIILIAYFALFYGTCYWLIKTNRCRSEASRPDAGARPPGVRNGPPCDGEGRRGLRVRLLSSARGDVRRLRALLFGPRGSGGADVDDGKADK